MPNSFPLSNAPRLWGGKALLYWSVVVAWMALISLLSGEPFSAANTNHYIDPVLRYLFPDLTPAGFVFWHSVIRKAAHFIEFFVLGCLAFWAARQGTAPGWRLRWSLVAIAVGAIFALIDEGHQTFIANRTGSLFDVAVDTSGVVASQLCLAVGLRWRNR